MTSDTTAATPDPQPQLDDDTRLRGVRLFLLAAGLFVFLTAELYPVGVMPVMSHDLHQSESAIGRLVTWYAIGVGVASIPIVLLTQRLARRTVIVGSLLTLTASMALAAVAPNLTVIAIARLVGAAAHGAIFAVVPVAAASLAQRGQEAKAVTAAFLGGSVGVVAGPPFVAALSQHLGWRWASAAIALIALGVAVASARELPPLQPTSSHSLSLRIPRSMRVPFITLCAVTALIVTAHNAAYAFIAPILDAHSISGTGYALVLFAYGLAGALTTAYAGRHLDAHPARVTASAVVCMVASLIALGLLGGPVAGAAAAIAWGGSFGVLPVAMQTRVLTVTPGYNEASTPIYVVAFQVGISVGAYLGSVLILHLQATTLPLVAAGVTACALPALALGMRSRTSPPDEMANTAGA